MSKAAKNGKRENLGAGGSTMKAHSTSYRQKQKCQVLSGHSRWDGHVGEITADGVRRRAASCHRQCCHSLGFLGLFIVPSWIFHFYTVATLAVDTQHKSIA